MKNDETRYNLDTVSGRLSSNLKDMLDKTEMNQKQLANKLEISESTLSGYMKGNKLPGLAFLISLKQHFPNISLDTILFEDLAEYNSAKSSKPESGSVNDYTKYKGSYYLYYLDTNKKANSKRSAENIHESLELKFGVLYISPETVSDNSMATRCVAVIGLKKRDDAKKLKEKFDSLDNYATVCDLIKEKNPHGMYVGQFELSQLHIFIKMVRKFDSKDNALIVLHHAAINKDNYSGGLGTINSVSTGRVSDPIIQKIALSKGYAHISDEQIKLQLWFSPPDIQVKGRGETAEILKLAKQIYQPDNVGVYCQFNERNIETLLTSYLEYLISKNLENNQLWCGRVSSSDDDDWYHLLKESDAHYEKHKQGDNHELTVGDTRTDYSLH